jgi:hypothetical protein
MRCNDKAGTLHGRHRIGTEHGLVRMRVHYETTKSPRAPSELLLLTQSLKRRLIDAVLPLRPGQTIAVEAVG